MQIGAINSSTVSMWWDRSPQLGGRIVTYQIFRVSMKSDGELPTFLQMKPMPPKIQAQNKSLEPVLVHTLYRVNGTNRPLLGFAAATCK